MPAPTPARAALAALERALLRRRFAGLDLRLRLELLAFSLLAAGFFGWRVRIPLDGLVRHRGPLAGAAALAAGAVTLLALGAVFAGARHRGALRAGTGPPWLALPLPPAEIAAHLARVSSTWALWTLVPAVAMCVAAIGLVPGPIVAAIGVAFVALLLPVGRAGAALAAATMAPRAAGPGSGPPIERLLTRAGTAPRRRRYAPPRWARRPAWLALWRKDLTLSFRRGPARPRLATALLFALAAAAMWVLPLDPRLAAFLAFAGSLIAAAAFAEWIIELCGSDPFPVLRALPLGVGTVWSARVASALSAAALAVALQAVARALTLPPALWSAAFRLQLASTGVATLLIGTLGAHYGITLFPRADHALRVLSITLGLAIAASLMIPLVGWVTLFTGLIHSARRLPRWRLIEEN